MTTEVRRRKSPPKTMSAALKRIEELEQSAYWLQEEIAGCRRWGEENAEEAGRLRRLLTYRAKVGNAIAVCSHEHTEVGKLSGNVYCSDCQEILRDASTPASVPDEAVS